MTPLTQAGTVLAFALCTLSAPAFAHAHLKSAVPAPSSTVATTPSELDLSFSEGVNPAFTGVKVVGPNGTAVVTGTPTLGAGGDSSLVVPVSVTLGPGTYTVDWHALATDGHKTSGTYTFTIRP